MDNSNGTGSQLMNAHGYLDRVIQELKSLESPQKNTLIGVLQYLSDHIRHTRNEIGALRRGDGKNPLLTTTTDELEEVVTETARAANRIMDAAEAVERVAADLEAPASTALMDAVTSIYEASSFQDITGQRIGKIVHALQAMESNLTSLMEAFGPPEGEAPAAPEGDAALLNGPQLGRNASNQSDIDALFESLS